MGVLRKRFAGLTIFVCAVFSIRQVTPQSAASLTLVRAGRLLDPRTGSVVAPAAVLIEDGKIKEVGLPTELQKKMPGSARTIDLGNATLLPGLIDNH